MPQPADTKTLKALQEAGFDPSDLNSSLATEDSWWSNSNRQGFFSNAAASGVAGVPTGTHDLLSGASQLLTRGIRFNIKYNPVLTGGLYLAGQRENAINFANTWADMHAGNAAVDREELVQQLPAPTQATDLASRAGAAIGGGAGQMVPVALGAVLTGGVGGVAAFAGGSGAQSYSAAVGTAIQETGNVPKAMKEADLVAAFTAATSAIPGAAILGRIPGGSKLAAKLASNALGRAATRSAAGRLSTAAAAEGTQEIGQDIVNDFAREIVRYNKNLSIPLAKDLLLNPDRWGERGISFLAGAVVGGGFRAVGEVAQARAPKAPPVELLPAVEAPTEAPQAAPSGATPAPAKAPEGATGESGDLKSGPVPAATLTEDVESADGYVYHATNEERLGEIRDSGKLAVFPPDYGTDQTSWPDGSTEDRAYFINKASSAAAFAPAEGRPVILRTRDGANIRRESTGDRYTTAPVSANLLEYLGEDGDWHRLVAPAKVPEGATGLPTKESHPDQWNPNVPDWVNEGMIREGKNPMRMLNEEDASRPGTIEALKKDPIAPFLERTNPELHKRLLRGDLSQKEYMAAMKAMKAETASIPPRRFYSLDGKTNRLISEGSSLAPEESSSASEISVVEGAFNLLKTDSPEAADIFNGARSGNPDGKPEKTNAAVKEAAKAAGYHGIETPDGRVELFDGVEALVKQKIPTNGRPIDDVSPASITRLHAENQRAALDPEARPLASALEAAYAVGTGTSTTHLYNLPGVADHISKSFRSLKTLLKSSNAVDFRNGLKEIFDGSPLAGSNHLFEPFVQHLMFHLGSTEVGPGAQRVFEKVRRDAAFRDDPSAPSRTPESVAAAVAENINDAIKAGKDWDWEAENAVRQHINLAFRDVPDVVQAVLRQLENLAEIQINQEIGDVRSNERLIQNIGKELQDGKGLIIRIAMDADQVRGMDARKKAGDAIVNALSAKAVELAGRYEADPSDVAAATELLTLTDVINQLQTDLGIVQKETARTVQAGNITTDADEGAVAAAAALKKDADSSKALQRTANAAGLVTPEAQTLHKLITESTPERARRVVETMRVFANEGRLPQWFQILKRGTAKGFNKALDVLIEYRGAAMLSGSTTQIVNLMGGVSNTLLKPATLILGGITDRSPKQVMDGVRLYAHLAGESIDTLRMIGLAAQANMMGIPFDSGPAARSVWNAFHNESAGLTANARKEFPSAIPGKLGRLIRLPYRTLGTADEFWKQINARAYSRMKALDAAAEYFETSGTVPTAQALSDFVDAHMRLAFDPDGRAALDEDGHFIDPAAVQYAEEVTLTNRPMPGSIPDRVLNALGQVKVARLAVPFQLTPMNLFLQALSYLPGANYLLSSQYRARFESPDPDVRAMARGEMALGIGVVTAVGVLAYSGALTGGAPDSKEERDMLYATGWRPYSYAIPNGRGGTDYIEYRRWEPFGSILGLVTDFTNAWRSGTDTDFMKAAGAMAISVAQNITSKTYMTGVAEVADLLSQPKREGGRIMRRFAASFVPSISGQGARYSDQVIRDDGTTLGAVKARIPGLSKTVRPRRNIFGEVISPDPGFIPFNEFTGAEVGGNLSRVLSPAAYSRLTTDPVKLELAMLSVGFSQPSKSMEGVDLTQFRNARGQDAYDRLIELTGEIQIGGKRMHEEMERLFNSAAYQRLAPPGEYAGVTIDDPRVLEVQKVIGRYRTRARLQLQKEYPELKSMIRAVNKSEKTRSDAPILERLSK